MDITSEPSRFVTTTSPTQEGVTHALVELISLAGVALIGVEPGTELIVARVAYRHHGIYVGRGRVIHYAGWIRYWRGLVEEISVAEFAGRRRIDVGRAPSEPRHGAEIVHRARSRLGERAYNLFRNNCEHFCNWCQFGTSTSAQIEILKECVSRAFRARRQAAS